MQIPCIEITDKEIFELINILKEFLRSNDIFSHVEQANTKICQTRNHFLIKYLRYNDV